MRGAGCSFPPPPRAALLIIVGLLRVPPDTISPPSLTAVLHITVSTSNINRECGPLGARNTLRSPRKHFCQVFGCPPLPRLSPPADIANITRIGNRLVMPRHDPRKEGPPFTDGRCDALASYLREALGIRVGGVGGMLSALAVNGSQGICFSGRGDVFRAEGPMSHTRASGSRSPRPRACGLSD